VLAFVDRHPLPVRSTIADLARSWQTTFKEVDAIVARRPHADRMLAWLHAVNYARLIAWRAAEARLLWNWPALDADLRLGELRSQLGLAAGGPQR
jgi:hypothetical protein